MFDRFKLRIDPSTVYAVGPLSASSSAGYSLPQADELSRLQPHDQHTRDGKFFNGPMIEALFLF